ncbi:hypothetical protein Tco_0943001 [Tanacetum coccineum]
MELEVRYSTQFRCQVASSTALQPVLCPRLRSFPQRVVCLRNYCIANLIGPSNCHQQMVKLPENKMLRCDGNLLRYACENSSFIHNGKYWKLDRAYYMADLLQIYATPETLFGLHPDVGASFHLSRLLGFLAR